MSVATATGAKVDAAATAVTDRAFAVGPYFHVNLQERCRLAPSPGLELLQPAPNNAVLQPRAAVTRWLWNSVARFGVLALLSTPGIGQVVAETEKKPDTLGPVIVTSPQRKPARRAKSGPQPAAGSARVAGRARPQTVVPDSEPVSGAHDGSETPLNTNAVAASASRLGLTVREIPATVEVINRQTIADQGYRSVSEVAQGAVGVTSGDNAAEPSAFSGAPTPSGRSSEIWRPLGPLARE